jgi:hypothetical protein
MHRESYQDYLLLLLPQDRYLIYKIKNKWLNQGDKGFMEKRYH